MKRFQDRVAVVTGAASGIGRALAVELGRRGMHVAIADVNAAGLAETAALVEPTGRRVSQHQVDVADRERMAAFPAEVLAAHGGVHLVVNNAGVAVAATFEEQPLEDMAWLMGINFWGVVYGCKFFLPHLRAADEAHIVNLSSIFGIVGMPLNSSYCASKFAVRGLSESLRAELAETHIGVTSVHPGGIATGIAAAARFHGDALATRDRAVKMFTRMMPPAEAARQIAEGVRRNAARVLIAPEAHLLDVAKRLVPSATQAVIARGWKRFS